MNPTWFKAYPGLTTEELLALEGKYRIDSLLVAFEQALDQKAAFKGHDTLTPEEALVLAIESLEREVNNGGYEQFFWNSSNRYCSIIVSSLERIGCLKTAEITRQALHILPSPGMKPIEIQSVMQGADAMREELNRCDKLYQSSGDDIESRLFDFIKTNRKFITL